MIVAIRPVFERSEGGRGKPLLEITSSLTETHPLREIIMNPLEEALAAAELARDTYRQKCMDVWMQLQITDSMLCEEIKKLALDDQSIAEWVCRPFDWEIDSPAKMVATGRRDWVIQMVRRTLNGFPG